MRHVYALIDQYQVDKWRAKYGMEQAEIMLRRELIRNGFDLRHTVEITLRYKNNPQYTLYEQSKAIIDAGEAMKEKERQIQNNNNARRIQASLN